MRFSSLFLVGLLGSGCAAKKMMVRHADNLLEVQLLKRLPLYEAQKKNLSKEVSAFMNEQKQLVQNALPILNDLELSQVKIESQYDRLHSAYKQLALNFSKLMSRFMAQLDKKQQKEFDQKLTEENEEIAKTKLQTRLDKINERLEILLGNLSDEQKHLIKNHRKYFEDRHILRLKRREKLHERFREIYRLNLSDESRATYFYEAFEDYQMGYPESEKNKEIILQLIPTLSSKQKEIFKNRLTDLKEILQYYLETDY